MLAKHPSSCFGGESANAITVHPLLTLLKREDFTDAVIDQLNQHKQHLVFIVWGRKAQEKGAKIDRDRHLVIASAHPSPLAAHNGFFGSAPFSKTNAYLCQHGITPINWDITADHSA